MEAQDWTEGEILPCARCGYDVGKTAFPDDCPECGYPIWATYWELAVLYGEQDLDTDDPAEEVPEEFVRINEITGHKIFAVWVLQMSLEDLRPGDAIDDVEHHVSAAELCESLNRRLLRLGADAGYRCAVNLDLSDPQRVGELVFAMVEVGLLRAREEDLPSDFDVIMPASWWFENHRRHLLQHRLQRWPLANLCLGWTKIWWWVRDADIPMQAKKQMNEHWLSLRGTTPLQSTE